MSSAFDQPIVSVFDEIPTLSKESADVYGCLLNNGLCMIQPEIGMDLDVVKKAMGWYYCLVRAVFGLSRVPKWLLLMFVLVKD